SPRAASFPPVKQVPYASEKFLVEDAPTFEKIVLEIQTDGQIDPMSAFNNALNVMQKQLSVFNSEWNMGGAQYDALNDGKEIRDLLQKIETLNLSARSFNCLDRANIKYIGEIVLMTEAELKEVKNLGKKSTDEIKEKMEEIGYPIGGNNISPETLATLQKRLAKLK
ncbi:MAG: DNA-directed RNA polymerase subunit alpha, partial [Helicobacter sp.]|nr:DNA-directed RNA polymerase subunit alpha [Helicobacter sp.]